MSQLFNAYENPILDALVSHGVRFVVVGGAAVQHHGVSRPRDDLDIVLEPTPGNASRFAAALQSCGLSISIEDVERIGQQPDPPLQTRLNPPFDIDVLTSIKGVAVDEALRDAVSVYGGGASMVPVLSKEHLIASKRARSEEKDLKDLAALEYGDAIVRPK